MTREDGVVESSSWKKMTGERDWRVRYGQVPFLFTLRIMYFFITGSLAPKSFLPLSPPGTFLATLLSGKDLPHETRGGGSRTASATMATCHVLYHPASPNPPFQTLQSFLPSQPWIKEARFEENTQSTPALPQLLFFFSYALKTIFSIGAARLDDGSDYRGVAAALLPLPSPCSGHSRQSDIFFFTFGA